MNTSFSTFRHIAVILMFGLMAPLPGAQPALQAASHSDAPLIKQDPQANITDVYAFVGTRYNDPNENVLNVIVHVRPFSEPGDGVIYERFADDALYSIHITNPTNGRTILRYDYRFSSVAGGLKNKHTILSFGLGTEAGPIMDVGDARQNYVQKFKVIKRHGKSKPKHYGNFKTAPPNVGHRRNRRECSRTTLFPALHPPCEWLPPTGPAPFRWGH
jgi:hypothetical protein